MAGRILILTFLAIVQTSAAKIAQVPLTSFLKSDSFESDTYKFEWLIHKVAIIGTGPGFVVLHFEKSFRHSFRPSVGSLPIENSLRRALTFMYLNETATPAEIGITQTRPLLIPLSQM